MFFSFCLWLPWSHPLLQVWPPVKTCPSIPLCPPSLLSSALTPPVSLPPPAPPGGPLAPHPAPTALPFLGSHVHLTPSLSASQVWQPLLGWAEASCWLLRAPGRPNLFCWGTAPLPLPELAAWSQHCLFPSALRSLHPCCCPSPGPLPWEDAHSAGLLMTA